MKKMSDILLRVFAVGALAAVFAGGFSFGGYLIALMLGGETAEMLCMFIFKGYLPWVIRLTSVFTMCGLGGMYLMKRKALTADVQQ
jgi:uncharacterized membrane protein AbrB (regulator of aidB expression)|nr:hypothetical protein [uncultured Acetatifactor sp.]